MQPVDLTYFAIAFFLSLAGLIKWKYRKDDLAARLNRGLKGYVQSGRHACSRPTPQPVEHQGAQNQVAGNQGLIVA
jgi:hypothetical protein